MGVTHFGLLNKSSLKTFGSWPPIWLSIILSLYFLLFLHNYTFYEITVICGIFLAGFPIAWFVHWIEQFSVNNTKNLQLSQNVESFDAISKDPKKLITWLQK